MHERTTRSVAPSFRRRALIRATLAGAATTAGAALLVACGDTATPTAPPAPAARPMTAATVAPTTAPAAAAATTAPTTAATAATPAATTAAATVAPAAAAPSASAAMPTDGFLPSGVPGATDAYLKYPTPFKTITMIPGKGGKLTIFKASQLPPPTPKDQNTFWQELDKRLGVTTEYNFATISGYREKFATLAAGGDFPDITLLWPILAPDQYKLIQQGAFTDLTPYLGTPELRKEYPNLSKYPDFAWKNSLIRGKLYWVPRMNFLFGGNELMYRRDWAEKLGTPQPKNAEEFFNLMVAMTKNDPDGNGKADTYGLGAYNNDFFSGYSMGFLMGMHRVPNNWRKNADGTLTKDIETDEFKAALTFAKRLYDAGVYHPDTATWTQNQAQDAMIGGKIGAKHDILTQLLGGAQERQKAKAQNPAADLRMLVPFGFDGGKGFTFNQPGVPYANGFPAKVGRDQGRVRDLLRIMDFFGAVFGSEEYTFLTYGIRDQHHTIKPNGSPVLTERGKADVNEMGNISFPPRVFYFPEDPADDTIYLQNVSKEAIGAGVEDPTLGLFSATFNSKVSELNQLNIDRRNAIITGRAPLSALDTWLRDWRSRGGDMIRKEFQDELKAQ